MIPTLLQFISVLTSVIGAGKNAYDLYQEVFGNEEGGFDAMVTALEAQLQIIIYLALEAAAIKQAQAAAETGIDFLSVNLPNFVSGHTNSEISTYLTQSDTANALNDADTQANVMEQYSIANGLTDQETMEAIQTLPLYLTLGHICLAIYQARAVFAVDSATQATNWKNVSAYASRFQTRAQSILSVLTGARNGYISAYTNIEYSGDNPPYSSWSGGWQSMLDSWILNGGSLLKYAWSTTVNEGQTNSNFDQMVAQVTTLISLHTNLLGSPTYPAWQAILQAASKSDQLPQATHFEDYFTKSPVYPPAGGYAMQAYQYGLFVTYLTNAINGLGQIAKNPGGATSVIQPPAAPAYDPNGFEAQFQNGQSGPGSWTPGYQVQYAVSFYLGNDPANPDYESALGSWSQVITSETAYYPLVTLIQVDPTGLAAGRKIYRQFQGQSAEWVGSLADNISTTFQDTNSAAAVRAGAARG